MQLQSVGAGDGSKSSEARLLAPGWWPRKGDRFRNEYVGAAVCVTCHASKASFKDSAMAHAATHVADAESLHQHGRLAFKIGAYNYEIADSGGKSVLRISKGGTSHSAVLLWAFGKGRIAQTYVYEENGKLYESHLSFFTGIQALDITPGHPRSEPPNLEEGVGRLIPVEEKHRCFGCHTTASTTKNGFDPRTPFPGVTCEACHGPGAKHVAAIKSGDYEVELSSIMNPAHLKPVDSVDFCGACHRTWQDVALDSPVRTGTLNVRFQPYRLESSRCWKEGKGDARITCLSCHDPHQPLVMDPEAYDAKCLQCHLAATGGTKKSDNDDRRTACPIGVKLCVTCHMPRFKNPLLHATFTDHWIRIAPPGAQLPD
jgi:Cytochrome c554 and c-prime